MNHALVLQNQALYLVTLHNCKEGWLAVRHYSYKLLRITLQIIDTASLSDLDNVILCAAMYCLEHECTQLDKIHGIE